MPKEIGFELWRGKSHFNGSEIVSLATLKSANEKTGNMVQVWILDANNHPVDAVKSGADASICGDCKHRGQNGKGRSCYVTVFQAPSQIWKSWKAGRYPKYKWAKHAHYFKGRKIRLGAYGDPSMMPYHILRHLTGLSSKWTGYSHQWRHLPSDYGKLLMASVDTPEEAIEAENKGWRYFRATATSSLLDGEIWCVNETHGKTCAECMLCDGNQKATKNISIPVHGFGMKNFQGV